MYQLLEEHGKSFCDCCGSSYIKETPDSDVLQGIMVSRDTSIEIVHPHQEKTLVDTPEGVLTVWIITKMTEDEEERSEEDDTWFGDDDNW